MWSNLTEQGDTSLPVDPSHYAWVNLEVWNKCLWILGTEKSYNLLWPWRNREFTSLNLLICFSSHWPRSAASASAAKCICLLSPTSPYTSSCCNLAPTASSPLHGSQRGGGAGGGGLGNALPKSNTSQSLPEWPLCCMCPCRQSCSSWNFIPCLKSLHQPSTSECLAPQDLISTSSHTPSWSLKSQKSSLPCTFAPSCLTSRISSSTWITPIYPSRFNPVSNLPENN